MNNQEALEELKHEMERALFSPRIGKMLMEGGLRKDNRREYDFFLAIRIALELKKYYQPIIEMIVEGNQIFALSADGPLIGKEAQHD